MLVSGGWRWRERLRIAPGVGCAVVAGVIAMMGCGGRTSMLELEGYELGGSSFGGSSVTGGRATGTAGTTSTAGTTPIPTAGAPSTATMSQCAQYCSGYAKTCAKDLKGQDCQRVCQAEIDGFGAKCQMLGLAAIKCLTPFFQPGNGSCEAATSRGLAQCGTALANFKTCETGKPTPTPTPTPTPAPQDPTTCPNMGAISPGSCDMSFACADGLYRTTCDQAFDGGSTHCFCYHDNTGWMGTVPTRDYSVACYLAASQCPVATGGTGGFQ